MWSRNKELFLMPCLFAVFEICHRSHSPLCSLFQIPKPTKIQVKIGQLILSPLLEEIRMEESAWRVGRPESAERVLLSFLSVSSLPCARRRQSFPFSVVSSLIPVSESGSRFVRVCPQVRSRLPPGSFASAPRFVRVCPQVRLRLLPCSLTEIGKGLRMLEFYW